jgi:RNA polymerase sigma-70 factor (ECF subfamily)
VSSAPAAGEPSAADAERAGAEVTRLFRAYHAPLVRYLTRRLGDRDWAEEVAQETFLRALRQVERHGAVASERSWLFAVATNLVRDEARRDERRRRHLQLLAAEAAVEAADGVEPGPIAAERALEEARARAHDAALARRAVDALAERDRLALLMREEGLDYQEIADALGLSVGSVGTTLARARRRLVERYEALARGAGEGTHAVS